MTTKDVQLKQPGPSDLDITLFFLIATMATQIPYMVQLMP